MTVLRKKFGRTGDVTESFWNRIRSSFFSITAPKYSFKRSTAKHAFFSSIFDPVKRLWHRFLDSIASVMIRTKIMGIVTLGFLVSVLAIMGVAWQAYRDTTDILKAQFQQHGIDIANTLADYTGEQLILGNQPATLSGLAESICNSENEVVYVLILKPGSTEAVRVVASGLTGTIPDNNPFISSQLYLNTVPPSVPPSIKTVQYGNDTVDDVAVMVPNSVWVVRVGLTESSITNAGMQNLRHMLYLAAGVSVLWLLLAYFLSSILVRPVHRLLDAIRGVEGGPAKLEDPFSARKDEISRLGVTFGVMNKELQRRDEIRNRLLSKVINAQEEERKRIARELHDQTGQSLTSLIVGLKVLESHDTGESQKRIGDMKQLATTILHEIHNLAIELRPSSLDDLGLIAALRQYTKEYTTKFGIPVDFQANGLDDKHLPPETGITLYRIIQEALTNIVKHAAATKVSVLLASRDGSIVAIVEDNGKGFDVEKVFVSSKDDHKLGLYGMQERAELIGGAVTIESTWMGTSVFIQAPLEGNAGK